MTWWKIVIAWWLIGAVWQVWTMLNLRRRYGGYTVDLVTRAVLGRWWLVKAATACFFWPIGMWLVNRKKPYALSADEASRLIVATQHLATHCPDCGEPLTSHEDLSQ